MRAAPMVAAVLVLTMGLARPSGAKAWSTAADRQEEAATAGRRFPEQTADLWREVKSPGYARSRVLLRHGLVRLALAVRAMIQEPQLPQIARAYIENAIVRLHLAHASAPRDPEALYVLAMARILWSDATDGTGGPSAHDDDIMALLQELRRVDPEYQAARVAFELAILHTRAHRFDLAAAEYERCLSRILLPTEGDPSFRTPEDLLADRLFGAVASPTIHYDLGDVTMAQGDLPGAIEHYRLAIAQGTRSGQEFRTVLLSHWGLAAALDRFGEHEEALEHAREAARLDDEPMAVLHLSSVFFEPPYELHYYEALGHTVLAEGGSGTGTEAAKSRRKELQAAASSWKQFLGEGGDRSPWADLARKHLAETEAALRAR